MLAVAALTSVGKKECVQTHAGICGENLILRREPRLVQGPVMSLPTRCGSVAAEDGAGLTILPDVTGHSIMIHDKFRA